VSTRLRDAEDHEVEQLRSMHLALRASLDMQTVLEALDAALGDVDRFGRRWLQVRYDRVVLGRMRARVPIGADALVETRTLAPNEDPLARSKSRSLGYNGLEQYKMLGALGGTISGAPRLAQLKVCPFSLVVDAAARVRVEVTTLLEVATRFGDHVEQVRRHYFSDGGLEPSAKLLVGVVWGALSHTECGSNRVGWIPPRRRCASSAQCSGR
jgi:hypothetical protein